LSTKSRKSMHPLFMRKKNMSANPSQSCQKCASALDRHHDYRLV
jgi:hypothetical protein